MIAASACVTSNGAIAMRTYTPTTGIAVRPEHHGHDPNLHLWSDVGVVYLRRSREPIPDRPRRAVL